MNKGPTSILVSGILMGTLPIFVRNINLKSFDITFFRFLLGFSFILLFIIIKDGRFELKKDKTVLLLSVFNVLTIFFYISSLQLSKVAISALLLYMAPIYVTIISFFKHRFVNIKSLAITFIGLMGLYLMLKPCQLLSEGLIFGLLSGISYAFVFILAKDARRKFSAQDVTASMLGISCILYFPLFALINYEIILDPKTILDTWFNLSQIPWILGLGLIPTAIPFTLFNYGIKYCKIERAPILALIEPITVSFIGYFLFKELLSLMQIFGAILILISIFLSISSEVEER